MFNSSLEPRDKPRVNEAGLSTLHECEATEYVDNHFEPPLAESLSKRRQSEWPRIRRRIVFAGLCAVALLVLRLAERHLIQLNRLFLPCACVDTMSKGDFNL